jgi:hypothetical protein
MLTGSTVLKRAMALAALALPAVALTAAGPGVAAASPTAGTSCTTESWVWAGPATLDASTAELDTGVIVPVVVGTTLTVVGVSADGLDATGHARVMPVAVGGVGAVAGSQVPGGRLVVLGDGAPATVSGVTVVLDRCAEVQSAAPEPVAPPRLPSTGWRGEAPATALGAAAIGVGSAMVLAGRRRPVR